MAAIALWGLSLGFLGPLVRVRLVYRALARGDCQRDQAESRKASYHALRPTTGRPLRSLDMVRSSATDARAIRPQQRLSLTPELWTKKCAEAVSEGVATTRDALVCQQAPKPQREEEYTAKCAEVYAPGLREVLNPKREGEYSSGLVICRLPA